MGKDIIQNSTSTNKAVSPAKAREKTLLSYIERMKPQIAKALPSVLTPERFTRIVTTAVSANQKLAECTPASFLGAMMCSAQLGLEPNTPLGEAYLIPYKNKGRDEVQFQIGYKGLIDLAYRSGEVSVITAHIVYSNDDFKCCYGLEPELKHTPAQGDRGEAVSVYAMFKTKDGGYGFEVMSIDEVKAHAQKYSKAYSSSYSPWTTNFEEMAKKTVLKKVLKYAPMSPDYMRADSMDGTIKSDVASDMSIVPDEVVFETEGTEVAEADSKADDDIKNDADKEIKPSSDKAEK